MKSLNPNVALHLNIKGVYSFNRYWTNAVYHPLFANHVDVISFDTGGYDARVDASTGALVSQIRSFKMARRLGASCEEPQSDELRTAVHMACGHETSVAGYPGAPYIAGAHSVFTPIMEFFREHRERYYTGTDNVADLAVVRNWPSMAYSINAAYVPATLMEQVLIQYKVPFDLLFDEQLDRIGRYGAVILAGQECVSNRQAQMLLKYVRAGGTNGGKSAMSTLCYRRAAKARDALCMFRKSFERTHAPPGRAVRTTRNQALQYRRLSGCHRRSGCCPRTTTPYSRTSGTRRGPSSPTSSNGC